MKTTSSRVICVLGMHRSGTSCLAGTLEQGGLLLGDVQTHNAANLRGNRESPRIMALHDDLLRANGCAWDSPPAPGVELIWSDDHRCERDAIIAGFADRPMWGFKDPRTLLALAGWREALPQLETVGIFRHPHAVAGSLHARGEMPLEQALNLWTAYNRRLLTEWRERGMPMLSFDGSEEEFRAQTRELGKLLRFDSNLGGETFFAAELRHQEGESSEALPAEVAELYAALQGAAMKAPALAPATVVPELAVMVGKGVTVGTLQSLRAGYQTGVSPGSYAVDGNHRSTARLAFLSDPGALLSPGLISLALRLAPDAVLTAPAYRYDPALLAQTGWPHAFGSGERLFDVSQPMEEAGGFGFVAMSRAKFESIGGDLGRLAELRDVRWLFAAGEGTFHSAADAPMINVPEGAFQLHGPATRAALRLLSKATDLPLALGDGTAVAQLKAKNNELRAKIEGLKLKNAELRARGDRWKLKAEHGR